MNLFYSQIIVPLFNKQTPLPEGELRDEIEKFGEPLVPNYEIPYHADILEKISQIGSTNSGRINLSQFIDLSSISSACKEHGVDILSIVAPVILGANKAIDDNSRNR